MRTLATLAAVLLVSCQPEPLREPTNAAASNESASVIPVTSKVPVAPASDRSAYSSLDLKGCQLIEKNEEEGGYYRHLCPGVAGYRLELVESDLRQDLAIVAPGAKRVALELPSSVGGGGFSQLGQTVEWRGPTDDWPRTLIARFAVQQGAEPTVPDKSHLLVARLKPVPCVVAVIDPGPDQNGKARAIADGTLPGCRRP